MRQPIARIPAMHVRHCWVVMLLLAPLPALAGCPPFDWIDHVVTYDDSGIWKRDYQKDLAAGAALTVIGGALFTDNNSRIGRTFDQTFDSMILTAGTTTAMKYVFSRERPSQNADPCDFLDGSGHQSFPSGEVAEVSSIVTPFILEYGHDHPAVYLLSVLPVYDAIARVKVHGHWQSDVLVGAGVGIAWGVYAQRRHSPLILGLLPDGGVMLGYQKQF